MKTVRVNLEKNSYDILIGKNILQEITKYIKSGRKVLIISNDKVGKIYSEKLINIVKTVTENVFYFEIKDGEEYKDINTVLPIYDYLIDNNFDRSSLIISLGGGVVCDLTGYVASTFMRGVDFIQIPTSLLAQVDASIGGKVAVNHPKGKNLIGSFYQPKLVLIDIAVLHTLDIREVKTGIAEIIKHSVIRDKDYFDYLSQNAEKILALDDEAMIHTINRSCEIKAEIVALDETEQSVRAYLNYGHTFGHVVESLTKYKVYQHGEAIVSGMTFAALLAEKKGMVDSEFIKKQNEIFSKFGIDYRIPKYNFDKVLEILKHDKKVKDGNLIFILPEKIGSAAKLALPEAFIKTVYEECDGKEVKGVIDIGTNTTRLFIAETYKGEIVSKYYKETEITRLGEDVDKTRELKEIAIDRTATAIKRYSDIAKTFGVHSIRAFATSATRDSQNRDIFINRVFNETGIKIEMISGEEEGTAAFRGVTTDKFDQDITVIDIGGGSTEFILGNSSEIKFIKSLNIGAVRLKEKFFADENYSEENFKKAAEWIKSELEAVSDIKKYLFTLVGVAGTVTTQVSVIKEMKKYSASEVHRYNLTMEKLNKNLELFASKNLEERKNITGLEPKRAEVIVSGTFLLKTIMEFLGKDVITVSENDILEGLMLV